MATCQAVILRHSAPQAQVYRAELALLLRTEPTLNNVAAGQRLGKHENWVRSWRCVWVHDGFRLTDAPGRGRKPAVSPLQQATVVALAGELPAQRHEPLSRASTGDLARRIAAHPAAPLLGRSTIWRVLARHLLKPWRDRSWLFPSGPEFAAKAGKVLGLDAGVWGGAAVGTG